MSRSALWRQEGNVQERERRAHDIFETACQEGRSKPHALPLWGSDESFHFNSLLLRNTIQSPYFQKCCQSLNDWNAVIDEIYYEVKNLQPFQVDRTPSTAFCLLLRLLTMRMTAHQVDLTLKHADSPYIRGIGFLYLRYACPPEQMWSFIQPYLQDEEEFQVVQGGGGGGPHRRGGGGASKTTLTMGDFVRNLFTDREYYGTPLPRLPGAVERDLGVKLLQAERVGERAAQHFKNANRMKYFQTLGNHVMALYGDEENPIQWYKAVVDRVITRDDNEAGGGGGGQLKYPRFVVTFPEYGNTETVTLGEMDVMDGNWRHDRLGHQNRGRGDGDDDPRRGGGGRRRDDDDRYLYEEVRRRERDTATADRGWARRPPSAKSSLSQASTSSSRRGGYSVQDDDHLPRRHLPKGSPSTRPGAPAAKQQQHHHESQVPAPSRKRTPEEMAAIADKKRKLMARYG